VGKWLEKDRALESLCGRESRVAGVLKPVTADDVRTILSAASEQKGEIKIQPVSCGRNWGFGSNLPVVEGVYLLDLSRLKKIRSTDLRGHCVEIEPGVTQGELSDWLAAQGDTHYFNVTGAGLDTSVIGNALERGIGYSGARHLDLLDMEIVLPSGEQIHTARYAEYQRLGYQAGLGPDPSGLFCQSHFGVVTAATIALYRRPEKMGAVLCRLGSQAELPALITAVSDLLAEGAGYGVPHLFNRERIVTSFAPYLKPEEIAALQANAAPWTALLPIKGSGRMFEAAAETMRERLEPFGAVEIMREESGSGPKLSSLLQGRPTNLALASVYYSVFGRPDPKGVNLDTTDAGLIHITPVVRLRGGDVEKAIRLTHEHLEMYGYENVPLSLNALSSRSAALIVSLGFDRRSAAKTANAQEAATALMEACVRAGFLPYRVGLDQAGLLPEMDDPWPRIFAQIGRAFDPHGTLADSRYEPLWNRQSAVRTENEIMEGQLCIS